MSLIQTSSFGRDQQDSVASTEKRAKESANMEQKRDGGKEKNTGTGLQECVPLSAKQTKHI